MSVDRLRNDRGFSLIELLVSMGFLTVIITIVGGLIVSSLNAERAVREVTSSTTDGQLALNVIDRTVRNSTAIRVTTSADGESVMVALRTVTTAAPRCEAFFYDAPTGRIVYRSSPSAIVAPEPGGVAGDWNILSGGIAPITGGTTEPIFAAEGTRGLSINFTADASSGPSSLFVTTATGRGPLENASPTCF